MSWRERTDRARKSARPRQRGVSASRSAARSAAIVLPGRDLRRRFVSAAGSRGAALPSPIPDRVSRRAPAANRFPPGPRRARGPAGKRPLEQRSPDAGESGDHRTANYRRDAAAAPPPLAGSFVGALGNLALGAGKDPALRRDARSRPAHGHTADRRGPERAAPQPFCFVTCPTAWARTVALDRCRRSPGRRRVEVPGARGHPRRPWGRCRGSLP